MGTTAARKSGLILENTLSVLAYELLTACQAIDLRRRVSGKGALSPLMDKVYKRVRKEVPFMDHDREIRLHREGRAPCEKRRTERPVQKVYRIRGGRPWK